jgi:transcriptional regulator with PAS, ATPase and Fis domain
MKKKPLSHYLDLMKTAHDKQEYVKEKKYGEIALTKLSTLVYSPVEKYLLYGRLGIAYFYLTQYSRSLEMYYTAYLIASKSHLTPEQVIFCNYMLGYNLFWLNRPNQATPQFLKVEKYFQQYGDETALMNKEIHFLTLISLGHCYICKNDLEKAEEIIQRKLFSLEGSINNFNYYILKAQYLMERKEYAQARQCLQDYIKNNESPENLLGMAMTKIHLARAELLDKQVDAAIQTLESGFKYAQQLKLNDCICHIFLLLSKCYIIKGMPGKAAMIENKIKPILNKLDIAWFYEINRAVEQDYNQLQPIYQTSFSVPQLIVDKSEAYYQSVTSANAIITKSNSMMDIFSLIGQVAPTNLPILIQGETGTGKELIARAIHNNSLRKENIWLATNCGSIPETLLENELFGHDKGAFTDAKEDKKGYIELASEGTLFLDEIADMSLAMQQKLLRVMDEKLVWRVGSEKPIQIDTRFIFASNKNIEELVKAKKFREDLYYRVNTIVITLPPLRDRKDDIPLLVNHFLTKYAVNHPSSLVPVVSSEVLSSLQSYSWPGNVRELENEIKRICALYPGNNLITEKMLPERLIYNQGGIRSYGNNHNTALSLKPLKEAKRLAEENVIIEMLKKCNYNITRTAQQLGCRRQYLQRKIKNLNIEISTAFVTKK